MVLLELLQGVLAVTDGGHPVVLALEVGGHRIADGLLIFNQKNASRFVAHGNVLLAYSLAVSRMPKLKSVLTCYFICSWHIYQPGSRVCVYCSVWLHTVAEVYAK